MAAILAGCAGSADRTPSYSTLPRAPGASILPTVPTSGGTGDAPAAATPSASPSPSPASGAAGVPASPVTGIVISVDSAGLTDVRGFQLRTAAGDILDLVVGLLENGAEFPPGHLAEHIATSEPVRVHFRDEGGRLVAYRIEDAG